MSKRTLDVNLHPSLSDTHPVGGVLAIRGELAAGDAAEVEEWHLHEHLLERVSTPGFLRGRRCVTGLEEIDPGRVGYLVVYEADRVETFNSEEYLARLDNPTPLTRGMVSRSQSGRRTAGRVTTSLGRGVGRTAILSEFSVDAGDDRVFEELDRRILPGLLGHREVVAARACRSEDEITAAKDATAEGSRARARTTGGGGFVLVDVTGGDAAQEFARTLTDALEGLEGVERPTTRVYGLQLVVTDLDC